MFPFPFLNLLLSSGPVAPITSTTFSLKAKGYWVKLPLIKNMEADMFLISRRPQTKVISQAGTGRHVRMTFLNIEDAPPTLSVKDFTSLHIQFMFFRPGSSSWPFDLCGVEAPRRQRSQIDISYFLWFPPELAFHGLRKYFDGCMDEWLWELAIILCIVGVWNSSFSTSFSLASKNSLFFISWPPPPRQSFHFPLLSPKSKPSSLILNHTPMFHPRFSFCPSSCPSSASRMNAFLMTLPRSEAIHILRNYLKSILPAGEARRHLASISSPSASYTPDPHFHEVTLCPLKHVAHRVAATLCTQDLPSLLCEFQWSLRLSYSLYNCNNNKGIQHNGNSS